MFVCLFVCIRGDTIPYIHGLGGLQQTKGSYANPLVLKVYCPDIYTVPTLQRNALEDAWGFSLIGGLDYLEAAGRYSGIVTQRGDVGLWLKVIPLLFLITCY